MLYKDIQQNIKTKNNHSLWLNSLYIIHVQAIISAIENRFLKVISVISCDIGISIIGESNPIIITKLRVKTKNTLNINSKYAFIFLIILSFFIILVLFKN